jgi:hypothetical protein
MYNHSRQLQQRATEQTVWLCTGASGAFQTMLLEALCNEQDAGLKAVQNTTTPTEIYRWGLDSSQLGWHYNIMSQTPCH